MSGIVTNRPLRQALESRGYCQLSAADLSFSGDLWQAWLSLSIDYADLPVDKYLPDGGKYRFRRYGRFRYLPTSGELARLPHINYFQNADINRVTGGYLRRFAPLLDNTFENPFLHELIRFDFLHFPVSASLRESWWEVQVHLIRVIADAAVYGLPTPEGIHRDGAEFVTVHLAELINAAGGEVSIYTDDKNLLNRFRLDKILDSYLFNDADLWHQAEAIRPVDDAHRAIRSILTFDYHLVDDSS